MVASAKLADDGCCLVDGSGNKGGIVAVCCVPVTSVEYPYGLFAKLRQGLVEADEAMFVVDLQI